MTQAGDGGRIEFADCSVLRFGGLLLVLGGNIPKSREEWYVQKYFNNSYETDLNRFPSWDRVTSWFDAAGFEQLELVEVESISETRQGREIYGDTFLRKNACFQLALLSDFELKDDRI